MPQCFPFYQKRIKQLEPNIYSMFANVTNLQWRSDYLRHMSCYYSNYVCEKKSPFKIETVEINITVHYASPTPAPPLQPLLVWRGGVVGGGVVMCCTMLVVVPHPGRLVYKWLRPALWGDRVVRTAGMGRQKPGDVPPPLFLTVVEKQWCFSFW
jgi:hypothetical protein